MQFPPPGFDQEKAQSFTEMLPDGFISAGADAKVLYLNGRAERIIGMSRADLVGRDIREALALQERDGSRWWQVSDPWSGINIRSGHGERLLMLPNGREVLVTAKYLRPGRNEPVHRVLLGLRDAEGRRRAEADHAALISTVAHELRSPLTSVKGFSSTLLRRWDLFSDDQKRLMLETIEADADRLTRLITELLDVSRLDSGRLRINLQPIDVPATFRRHVDRSVASGQAADDFVVEVADDLPEVWADPDRFDQILANLIENARIHGGGRIMLRATPADAPDDVGEGPVPSSVVFGVSDEGDGIPTEHRTLVFSRFWHGSAHGSTGLGLYVVKGLVEAHGGQVAVHGDDGDGAEIRFTLPGTPPEHLA